MFDLEKAIAQWLARLSQRGGFTSEDLEELEGHVRDHVAAQMEEGATEREAFQAATRRVGDASSVASEYRKMTWTNARTRNRLAEKVLAETAMTVSYAKIGLRNLLRQKTYSTINVLGLSIGLACCLLIALYVRFELSFDRHHERADRIYRVSREWRDENGRNVLELARISRPIGPALEREFPEVERSVRLLQVEAPVEAGDKRFIEERVFVADSTFFDVFSAPLVQGDPKRALAQPNAVVLTQAMAEKYFGDRDPVGESLRLFDELDLEVTGVMEAQPAASHFHPDFLVSFRITESWTDESERADWGQYNNYGTYLLLAGRADAAALEDKLPGFLRAHYQPANNAEDVLKLQPVTGIHLDSHLDSEFEPSGNRSYVILFIAIGALVLIIACFNFINLATARSSYRSKEVGLRKVLGAEKSQLVKQFLGEAAVLTVLSLIVALGIVRLTLPEFARLSGRAVAWSDVGASDLLATTGCMVVIVSLLAGLYPAVYLSRFQPAEVFRRTTGGSWRSGLRSILVVSQFAISIALIVGVGIVLQQLSYVQNKDLGFDKERLVVLPISDEMRKDFERFRLQLEASPAIESVTASKLVPSRSLVDYIGVRAEVHGEMRKSSVALNPVDQDFINTYRMHIVAGRNFSKDLAADSTEGYVINEATVRLLGWNSPQEAVGQPFIFEGSSFTRPGAVIGVVKDFNFESLRNKISPLAFFIMPERWQRVTVRIAPLRIDEALQFLEDKWRVYRPDLPFTYSFVDKDFGVLYQADRKVGTLFGYFSVLAVVIAVLGLLGLASFVMEKRRREIGVRKVLGATVGGIVRMLSADFLRLIAIAFVVACPIAYFAGRWWLEHFAYRSDIGIWLFAAAGAGVAVLALATVSTQSIKTALADPVIALKHE